MPAAAARTRPLLVLGTIVGLILLLGVILGMWTDRVQPEPVPTLEERRPIDADPTPPDRPVAPVSPIDPRTAPAPTTPPSP